MVGTSWNPNSIIVPFNDKKDILLFTKYKSDPGLIYYKIVKKKEKKIKQKSSIPELDGISENLFIIPGGFFPVNTPIPSGIPVLGI